MIIRRVWQMPNKYTFTIPAIKELVDRYVGDGLGWADPFAGMNSPAEYTNDLNPDSPAKSHKDAFDYVDDLHDGLKGVIFDPPYSIGQVKRSYDSFGLKSRFAQDPSGSYKIVKDKLAKKVINGGLVICCGWDGNGFGLERGFDMIEFLVVPHGACHHATLVSVERKVEPNQLGLMI